MGTRISVYMNKGLQAALQDRTGIGKGNLSRGITRCIVRYAETVRVELDGIDYIAEEWGFLLAVLIPLEVIDPDGIRKEVLGGKHIAKLVTDWNIDGDWMLERLKDASYAELCAIADVAERWQAKGWRLEMNKLAKRLVSLGVVLSTGD